MDVLRLAREEATDELARELLRTAESVMKRHGEDPQSGVIVAAGFAAALRAIGQHVDPHVPFVVQKMLEAARR